MKPRFALRLIPAIWRMYRKQPVFLSFNITNRCNQRCHMCNVWRAEAEELSLEEIARIFDEMKDYGIRIVELTGGETLLRKDLYDICRLLDDRGLLYTMTTNGSLIDDGHLSALRGVRGLLQIAISVDSLDPWLYAKLRGRDNLASVLANIDRLIDANLNIPIKINFTLSRHNYRETLGMLEYARSRGIFMSAFPVNQGPLSQHRSFDPFFFSTAAEREEMARVFHELSDLRRRGEPLWEYSRFYRLAADFVRGRPVGRCDAGRLYLDLHADGKLAPCLDREPFADLRKEHLPDAMMKFADRRRSVASCSETTPCCYTCTYNVSITARHIFGFSLESLFGRLRHFMRRPVNP